MSDIVNIHGKNYHTVAKRVKDFRKKYPIDDGYGIFTAIVSEDENSVTIQASIGKNGVVLATGIANEKFNSSRINKSSAYENAETSAIGRALAFAGFATDGTLASAEEVANAVKQQESYSRSRQDSHPSWVYEVVGSPKAEGHTWIGLTKCIMKNGVSGMKYIEKVSQHPDTPVDIKDKALYILEKFGD